MTAVAGRVSEHIDAHFDRHLELARTFVRQPSISADGTGILEMARLVARTIEGLGGTPEIISTPGNPVVFGHIDVGAPRTLLVYGMYDVQPVAGEEWISPPFEAGRVNLEEFGDCIVSRGIMNSKGPLAGTFSAIESLQTVLGRLPVNVKFLVEGEEELGSTHLPGLVRENKGRLGADGAFFPFYSQDPSGNVVLYLGTKGLVFIELTVRGGDWGAPTRRPVHGSNGAWLHNPAWVLVHALSSMLSKDQTRIQIDGMYDRVEPPAAEDEYQLAGLAQSLDPSMLLKAHEAARFKFDASPADLMRRFLFEPNLTIDGLVSGYTGSGSKTVLPHEAIAKIDFRLVPDMNPEEVVLSLRRHLDAHCFPQVSVNVVSAYPPSKSSIEDPINGALVEAYREFGFEPQIWPLIPGSAPIHLFTRDLGLQFAIGGLGHGGRQHSPNEYAVVSGMKLYEKSAASLILRFADSVA